MESYVKVAVRFVELVVTFLMGVVVTVVIAEAVARGALGVSLVVSDELSRFVMIWTAMLAAVLLVHEEGHMRITIVSSILIGKSRKIAEGLANLTAAAFVVMLIATTVSILPSLTGQNTVTLGVSMVWAYAALPVSGLLMLPLLLRNAWLSFRSAMPVNPKGNPS